MWVDPTPSESFGSHLNIARFLVEHGANVAALDQLAEVIAKIRSTAGMLLPGLWSTLPRRRTTSRLG